MFIGREQELNFLNSRYHSKNAELIFLYGRYRIGKTETLHEFCKDKEHIFHSCQECPDNIQLRNFSQSLLKENIKATEIKFTKAEVESMNEALSQMDIESRRFEPDSDFEKRVDL